MKIEEIVAKVGEDRIREAMESENDNALKDLLDEEGIALTDEQLDYIAGGVVLPSKLKRETTVPIIRPTFGSSSSTNPDNPYSPDLTDPDDEGDVTLL